MAAEESFPELLFICIFWLLHAIFSLTEYLMAFCYLLSAKWRSVFARDLEALDLEPVRNISKLPKHIAFLVLENDIVYDDVAKLVIWSLLVGINAISLYDVHGKLKRNQGLLLGAINREYVKHVEMIDPFKLIWRPHDDTEEGGDKSETVIVNRGGVMMYPDRNGNGVSAAGGGGPGNGNGHVHTRTVSVSLLSRADGKQVERLVFSLVTGIKIFFTKFNSLQDIVNVARRLGGEVSRGQLQAEDITLERVGMGLRATEGLPDPCVLVRYVCYFNIVNNFLQFLH